MVHLFTYLILWYWTHLKLSIRGVHLLCSIFSFCHFQYDVRVGLIYYLFPEHIWLATLSRRNKDLLEPQFPWRFGRILVVPGGESCACRFFFFPKALRFVHCFQAIFFFLQLPSACFFSAFCWWYEQRAGHTGYPVNGVFPTKSTCFPFPRAQFTYVQHFPIRSMHGIRYTYLHLP